MRGGRRSGPTSKAANINHTVRAIREYEAERDVRFASVTIHDAEDVVHPNEFKMTNYLTDDYDASSSPCSRCSACRGCGCSSRR